MSHATEAAPSILLVEDDDATREAQCLPLRSRGYDAAPAADAREAPGREASACRSVRRVADLPSVIGPVVAALGRLGYADGDVFAVRLALDEAVVNGIKHGNGGDAGKRVRVRYRVTAEEFWAEVEDEGAGFDPSAVADPLGEEGLLKESGRGLLLMRRCLDEVCYNAKGNTVTLRKRRGAAGGR